MFFLCLQCLPPYYFLHCLHCLCLFLGGCGLFSPYRPVRFRSPIFSISSSMFVPSAYQDTQLGGASTTAVHEVNS